jgi:hypothetical protein
MKDFFSKFFGGFLATFVGFILILFILLVTVNLISYIVIGKPLIDWFWFVD